MEREQKQVFNERLSQWISSQGFWFQLRHSMAGGETSSAGYHFCRLMFRVALFGLLLAISCWVYLYLRVGRPSFSNQLSAGLSRELLASDLTVGGVSRLGGNLLINRILSEGGKGSFYDSFEAINIRCKMGLLDGVAGEWKPGQLAIARMRMDIRSGADDAESAKSHKSAFLKVFPNFDMRSIEVADLTLHWGFSDRTFGKIEGSRMTALRTEKGWRMRFSGGTFTQNWLRELDINELVVMVDEAGMTIEKGDLNVDGGSIGLAGVTVAGWEKPSVSGIVNLKRVSLDTILPEMRNFIDGRISGNFKLSGSTNSPDGIFAESRMTLGGDEFITLRDRFHLLRALNSVGGFNSYRKVDFREGSLTVKSGGGAVELRDLSLKSGVAMILEGAVKVRPLNDAEVQAAMGKSQETGEISPIFAVEDPSALGSIGKMEAAYSGGSNGDRADDKKRASQSTGQLSRAIQDEVVRENMEREGVAAFSRTLRYEGALRISIPSDFFDKAPVVKELYPKDPTTNRIILHVPIEGGLQEITLKQAEELYAKGRLQN